MNPAFPPLYAILDSELCGGSEMDLAEILAASGIQLMQLRDKTASARALIAASKRLSDTLMPRGVKFIVNDRPDIAMLVSAGGVHVGQEDLSVADARAICGAAAWVGVSTHTLEQVEQADRSSADYVAFGPIYATTTKQNPDVVVGEELLRRAREKTSKPLIAIGGITLDRAEEVYRAGADSLAVARDLICAADPGAHVREYLQLAKSVSFRNSP
jgi:thiamine-phosphate pyrophosphorylase